jgi:hypothetical protein
MTEPARKLRRSETPSTAVRIGLVVDKAVDVKVRIRCIKEGLSLSLATDSAIKGWLDSGGAVPEGTPRRGSKRNPERKAQCVGTQLFIEGETDEALRLHCLRERIGLSGAVEIAWRHWLGAK